MGLFSKLSGRGAPKELDVPTAVMVPTVAAMLADGQIDDDELVQIRSIFVLSPIFASNSRERDTEIILKAVRLIEDDGPKAMCERAKAVLSPELRETSLAFAIMMVMSDGHIGHKEEQLIDDLVSWLEIDGNRAEMIAEVCAIMRHVGN